MMNYTCRRINVLRWANDYPFDVFLGLEFELEYAFSYCFSGSDDSKDLIPCGISCDPVGCAVWGSHLKKLIYTTFFNLLDMIQANISLIAFCLSALKMFSMIAISLFISAAFSSSQFASLHGYRPFSPDYTIGTYDRDFAVVGPALQAVHESQTPPTGLAIDSQENLYLTYPRNGVNTPNNVVIATSFFTEEPWPSASLQNCTAEQNASTCFVNVQNVVLDSIGQLWIVDSGIPFNGRGGDAIPGGAKIISFNQTTRELLRTYVIPQSLYYNGMNANDVRINNTLGTKGFAFITDESSSGSLLAINLDTGETVRRLYNTSVVRPDRGYVGFYDGQLIYSWNGTQQKNTQIGADGIALASGNVYWGVLSSHRYYFISQSILANSSLPDAAILAAVQFPGQCGSEQAGFTADDHGRVYILASETNAIYYVDTVASAVQEPTTNNLPLPPLSPNNYIIKVLVRSGLIQHADSAAIWDGWLYFSTNQLALGPGFQYNNTDRRRGPFRSYRVFVGRGRGPAV